MTNSNNKKKHRKNAAAAAAADETTSATRKRVGFDLPPDQSSSSASSKNNKKDKNGGTRNSDASGSAPSSAIASSLGTTGPGGLTKGQLAVLIVVSLGISRLLQVGSAAHDVTTTGADEALATTPSPVCVSHLGEPACQQASIRALLKYKFFTGVQLVMVAAAGVAPCWKREPLLQAFGMVLITLLGAFGTALLLSPGLLEGTGSNALMCLVLTAVSLPSDALPHRRLQYKSLQSLCLFTMAAQWASEAVTLVLQQHSYFYQREADAVGDTVPAITILRHHPPDDVTFWDLHKPAVDAIVNFVAFDKGAMALVLLFAWAYLPNANQRVRFPREQWCVCDSRFAGLLRKPLSHPLGVDRLSRSHRASCVDGCYKT